MIKSMFEKYDNFIFARVSDRKSRIFLSKLPIRIVILGIIIALVATKLVSAGFAVGLFVAFYLVTCKSVKVK